MPDCTRFHCSFHDLVWVSTVCVFACVRACVSVCVCACARVCTHARECVHECVLDFTENLVWKMVRVRCAKQMLSQRLKLHKHPWHAWKLANSNLCLCGPTGVVASALLIIAPFSWIVSSLHEWKFVLLMQFLSKGFTDVLGQTEVLKELEMSFAG